MTSENEAGRYRRYLEQVHSGFGVGAETVENAIQQSLGGLSVIGLTRIIAGQNNEVYDINTNGGSYILRISRSSRNRFLVEKWALDEAQKMGVPAPQMLFVGEVSDKGEVLKFCVESKVPGIAMSELIETGQLSKEQVESISYQTGAILAKIHLVIPRGFGKFSEGGKGKYDTWTSFVLKYSERERAETYTLASRAGIDRNQIDQAVSILEQQEGQYQGITPHLLHFDYGPKHVLVRDGSVSGIVDFENCMSGDPVYDLAWKAYFEEDQPSLEEGYLSVSSLPDNYVEKQRLYGLRIGLDLVRWFALENHTIGMEHARRKMKECLSFF